MERPDGERVLLIGNNVGHKAPITWTILMHHHTGLLHRHMLFQYRLDLAKLNPESPKFHLMIDTHQKLDTPIGKQST